MREPYTLPLAKEGIYVATFTDGGVGLTLPHCPKSNGSVARAMFLLIFRLRGCA